MVTFVDKSDDNNEDQSSARILALEKVRRIASEAARRRGSVVRPPFTGPRTVQAI